MKCYYEELGVERDANDGDIKSAYRKLALRWHPDKNPDCMAEAKERFQLIQQAYEVLSDQQERAWYDNHREQILRGKNSEYEDNCLDVFQYFTVSCFRGYGDDCKGFYAVYSEVFEKIAAEDAEFMDDEEAVADIPKFGDSQSSYDEVVAPFYAYWQAYCTKKSYAWLCPYNVQEIRDRRILREIEKDMKKIVQKAKKERNEEVRNLVAFIRKRDKRVQEYKRQLEERAALNRQKQEQKRLEQIRKRQLEVEEMRKNKHNTFNDAYEEQLKQLQQQYGDDSSADEDYVDDEAEDANEDGDAEQDDQLEEEEEYIDDLYCVACNKAFKNENAFANHETSKKHRENVERMRVEMQNEDDAFKEASEENSEDSTNYAALDEPDDDLAGAESLPHSTDDDAEPQATSKQKKKNKKKSKKAAKAASVEEHADPEAATDLHKFAAQANDTQAAAAADDDDDNWSGTGKKARKNKNKKPAKRNTVEAKAPQETVAGAPEESVVDAPPAAAAGRPPPPATAAKSTDPATTHVCVTCKASFNSKNKLFAHLKITNHGVYLPKAKAAAAAAAAAATVDGNPKKSKGKRK